VSCSDAEAPRRCDAQVRNADEKEEDILSEVTMIGRIIVMRESDPAAAPKKSKNMI
jgi:hypothetical protein